MGTQELLALTCLWPWVPACAGTNGLRSDRCYPPFFVFASSMSFNSFGGDIGSELGRTPMH
jgi:hypothetical protein